MAGIRTLANLASRTRETGVEFLSVIEPSTPYVIPQPIMAYADIEVARSQAWIDLFASQVDALAPEIALYRIDGCFITPNAAVMTFGGAVVQETLYPYARGPDIMRAFGPYLFHDETGPADDLFIQIRNTTRVRDPIFFAREHGEAGYFHWLHSVLPRARIYADLDRGGKKLAVALDAANYAPSLAMAGWQPEDLLVANGNTYLCDSLTITTPMVVPDVSRSGGFFERTLLAAKILREFREPRPPNRRIFISRQDALVRRLLNQSLILGQLAALNVEPLTLTGMSIQQQADLFASAELVISMHGAGLSNISFMEPGTKVIEILAPDRLWPTYRGVAARSRVLYVPYVGARAGLQLSNDSDIEVVPAHITDFVRSVLSIGLPSENRMPGEPD